MKELAGNDQPATAPEPGPLRFSCRHCGLELSAPLSAAGVVAPCPGCGGEIQAPLPPVEWEPDAAADSSPSVPESPLTTDDPPMEERSDPRRGERRVRKRRRKAVPKLSLDASLDAAEKRETRALLRFIVAVLATLAVTLAICWVVSRGSGEESLPGYFGYFTTD